MNCIDDCVFCNVSAEDYIAENELAYAVWDKYPVNMGHALVITKKHYMDFFHIPHEEMSAIRRLADEVKLIIDEKFSPDGYNVGANVGKAAGQTVFHFHFHIIPRYDNDNLWRPNEILIEDL
ncbi:HIT family protein [Peptoclostridium sp.]|uniref:HIT family protein n=1 Tax=Peptoclostridium sp. TaxID=1904860 RepID=UPI0025E195F0|nr:HIT family protein [Peptoclostridium sp.]